MKLVVDTSAFSAFGRGGDARLTPWFKPEHQLLMPLIVLGELRAGFALGSKEAANLRTLNKFLDIPNVEILKLTTMTPKLYADLYRQLRLAGKAVSTNDIWIAALAIEQGVPLLTLDADFQAIKKLQLAPL